MKLSSLVLCVGMLCVTTASKGLPQPHHLHKRQIIGDTCSIGTINNICTSGYYQGYANVALECNRRSIAESIEKSCRSSESGTLCGAVETYDVQVAINDACGRSPTTCPDECRDILISTRAQLGCCITNFNGTFSPHYYYSLWSLCGVETVTEECAQGPIVIPTEYTLDFTCNSAALTDRLYTEVLCRTEYLELLRNATIAFCGHDPNDGFNTCNIDQTSGLYCDNSQPDTYQLVLDINGNCTDLTMCDPLCVQNLQRITSCCFISEYNGTDSDVREDYTWLRYEYWSMCGIESPGFCARRLNNHSVNPAITESTTTLSTPASTAATTSGGGGTNSGTASAATTTGNAPVTPITIPVATTSHTTTPTTTTSPSDSTQGTSDIVFSDFLGGNAAASLRAPGIAATVAVALFSLIP